MMKVVADPITYKRQRKLTNIAINTYSVTRRENQKAPNIVVVVDRNCVED
jgi:hypothetical protein